MSLIVWILTSIVRDGPARGGVQKCGPRNRGVNHRFESNARFQLTSKLLHKEQFNTVCYLKGLIRIYEALSCKWLFTFSLTAITDRQASVPHFTKAGSANKTGIKETESITDLTCTKLANRELSL